MIRIEEPEGYSVFVPTPDEIAAACDRIQAGWTATERRKRQVGRDPVYVVPGANSRRPIPDQQLIHDAVSVQPG